MMTSRLTPSETLKEVYTYQVVQTVSRHGQFNVLAHVSDQSWTVQSRIPSEGRTLSSGPTGHRGTLSPRSAGHAGAQFSRSSGHGRGICRKAGSRLWDLLIFCLSD